MDCIFCKIIAKEIPAHIVYENDDFLAFLDARPASPGHTLVVPKAHHRWVWDIPYSAEASRGKPNIGEYFEVCKKIALAQQKAFATEMVLCQIVGEEVPHAHTSIFPDRSVAGNPKDFEGNAKKIKSNL